MDEKSETKLVVVKVSSPVEIVACDQEMANERSKVIDYSMRSHGHVRPIRLVVNKMYAVVELRLWKRVIVLEKNKPRDGDVRVKYVDFGLQGITSASKLLEIPPELETLIVATRRYVMPGLVPISIETVCMPDSKRPIQAKNKIVKTWSEASQAWIRRVIEDNNNCVEVKPLNRACSQNPVLCEMFIRSGHLSELRSLAELLLEKNFAARLARRSSSPGASPEKSASPLHSPSLSTPPGPREDSPSGSSDDHTASEQHLMQCSSSADGAPDSSLLSMARMDIAVLRLSSVRAPDPILSFDRSPLAVSIKRCLQRHRVGHLLFVQAHLTPIILRGMDVLAVAPPYKGKTTGVLMPLLTRLCTIAEDPISMPKGSGPFAIIVCPSWLKIRQAADYVDEFMKQSPSRCFHSLRTAAVFGSASDAKAEIDVTIGCELLIITPRLLVRLIEKQLIDFARLETIVMDGLDVLAEFYLDEVKKIVLSRKRNTSHNRPQQVIATASSWTPAVSSFAKVCMNNAVEIYAMCGVLEACLRMKMEHFYLPWTGGTMNKVEALQSFLVEVDLSKDAVVICTGSNIAANNIYDFLTERFAWERVLMLGEEEESDEQKFHVNATWNAIMRQGPRKPVLIAFDRNITPPLNIRDATVLIHYDLASRNDVFFRYNFVRAAMQRFEPDKPVGARCYFMCNQRVWAETPVKNHPDRIVETIAFMQRARPPIPAGLENISHNRKAALEIANGASALCPQLRSFGRCRLPHCQERHIVLGEVDRPLLPISGEVEFQLIHAKAANWLFVRLLHHRCGPSDRGTDYREDFLTLQTEMNDYFRDPENQRNLTISEIRPGLLVAVHSTNGVTNHFQRARVLTIMIRRRVKVKVNLIDDGQVLEVGLERVLELPSRLQHVPGQAVEMIVSRVQPLDEDTEFSPEATDFASQLIGDHVFFGRIALSLGNTLWMHSVAERVYHRATHTHVIDNDLRMVMMDKMLAVDNPEHLTRLNTLCSGQVDVAAPGKPGKFLSRRFTYTNSPIGISELDDGDTMALCGDFLSPSHFHLIRDNMYDKLWEMIDEIAEFWGSVKRFPRRALAPGTFALCLWPKTEEWNRVQILESMTGSESSQLRYRVRFIDFGETGQVTWEALRQLPDQFRSLPGTAIECSLAKCQPASGKDWSEKTEELLWNFFYDGSLRQPVIAKVVLKRPTGDDNRTHFVVDVVLDENDLNLAQHLIVEGVAAGNVTLAEQVFPEAKDHVAPLLRQQSPILLAFDLLKSQDYRRREEMCEALYQTVSNWGRANHAVRRNCSKAKLASILCRLIRFCPAQRELYFLYRAFVAALARNASNDEDFLEQPSAAEVVPHVMQHLKRLMKTPGGGELSAEQRERLLLVVAELLTRLVEAPLTCDHLQRCPGWAGVLCEALTSPEESDVVILRFLELCCRLPGKTNDDVVQLATANLVLLGRLSVRSPLWSTSLALLQRHALFSGTALRAILAKDALRLLWDQMEALRASASPGPESGVLDALVTATAELWLRGEQRRRVDFVQTADRAPLIDWLAAQCPSSKTGAFVFDMRTEISRVQRSTRKELAALLKPKKLHIAILKPRISPVPITIGEKTRPPNTKWFQGRKFIFLTIFVPRLQHMKISPIIMTERSIHFSSLAQGETLAFDLPLYLPVAPQHSLVKITEFEVRVKIRKVNVGDIWPHVTPDRLAPAWLTKDLEHVAYQAGDESKTAMEEAEETAGFTLPCMEKDMSRRFNATIERCRLRYRRRMQRLGRSVVGRPPDIDAGEWLCANGATANFVTSGESSITSRPKTMLADDESDDDNSDDDHSEDDSFYEESDSDLEDLDESMANTARNPATEDCVDHWYNW